MAKKESVDKWTEIQETSEYLEGICKMLDPEFLNKIRENSLNDNGISSIEYIYANLDNWIKKKRG